MTKKKESGIALVMALFILIVIMMLGMVFTVMMASETNTSVRESQSTKALYLADAGLQYAQYSAGMTADEGRGLNTLTNFNKSMGTYQSFSIYWWDQSGPSAQVSSWGIVYDSTLGYSVMRELAASLYSQ